MTTNEELLRKYTGPSSNPVIAAGESVLGITPSGSGINIPGLGETKTDKNIQHYTIPPEVAAAYAAIGNTQYTPQMVSAPGFSVGDIAQQYAFTPEQVTATPQSQFLTNQDAARQGQVMDQQLDEATRLRHIIGGGMTPADMDNAALLQQGRNLQLSAANSARGGSDQRLAAQFDATNGVAALGMGNISVLAAQRAQEQADARAQMSQVLGQTQQQDSMWQGAAWSIANADAMRAAQAASANQQATTTANIANAGAAVSAAGVDQNAEYTTTDANHRAAVRGYVDETGRVVAAGQGENAVQGLGITADAAYNEAERQAKAEQIRRQQAKLDYERLKKQAEIQKAAAAIGALGHVAGAAASGGA